jgi:RHS repeat-associated protein
VRPYGGNGLPAHASVQFTYEARPDAWKRYVDEARNDLRNRLSQITTYAGGTQVRAYALHYDLSPTSGRSMLDSVQVCARTPQTAIDVCLPKTSFAWGKPDPAKAPGFVSKGVWANAPKLTTQTQLGSSMYAANHFEYFAFADFENHGFTDGLEKRVASPGLNYSSTQIVIQDANSKLRGTLQSQYRYFHNNGNGTGFTPYNYTLNIGGNFVVLDIGDFNGDGAPDLLVSTGGGTRICLSPLGSPGGLPASTATPIVFTCGSPDNSLAAFANDSYHLPYVIDVYGNGRPVYYSPVSDYTTSGTVCKPVVDPLGGMKGDCFADANAPANVLGYTYSPNGNPIVPLHDYVKFNEMVDFPGTGRASDVRWTKPQNVQILDDGGQPVGGSSRICANRTPTVSVTSFQLPSPTPTPASVADTFTSYTYPTYTQPTTCAPGTVFAPYGFDTPDTGAGLAADFNGSGYSGLAFGFKGFSDTTKYIGIFDPLVDRFETTVCLSTGRGLDCGVRRKYSGTAYQSVRAVGHFIGDGQPTILVESAAIPTGNVQMCSLTGDDTTGGTGINDTNMVCTPWSGITMNSNNTSAATDKTYFMDLLGTGRTQMVMYHSGSFVGGVWNNADYWEVFEPIDRAVTKQALDRIYQVTNGVGNTSTVEYDDGVASGVVSRSASVSQLQYPQHVTGGVGKIVSRLRVGNGFSNGISAERTSRYAYKDAANDVSGRGSLGFREVTTTDEQTGIATINTYAQGFPFTGMVLSSIVKNPTSSEISNTQNRYLNKAIPQGNLTTTFFPYLAGSVVTRYDLDGASTMGSITTTGVSPAGTDLADVQYDNWGNMIGSKVTSTGSALSSTYSSATSTINTFFAPDTTHWLVGLLQRNAVTNKQSTDTAGITRTVDYTYEPDFSGHVRTETLESSDPTLALKLTTTYTHHPSFGVVIGKVVTWRNLFTNTDESRGETTNYDPNGRYPDTLFNALSQSEKHVYDPGSGAQTSLTGPNQLTTSWAVDGFGRVNVETRADGNETRQYRKQCQGDCPAGAVTAEINDSFHGVDRIAVPQIVYRDNAGHVLRTQTWGYDGRAIVSDQRYDSLGRLYEADQPRFDLDASYLARRQLYDALGRVKVLTTFDDTGAHDTITTYKGFVIEMTNPKAQTRLDSYDVLGRVVQVKDANQQFTGFTYDQFGNLNKTTDPNGNVIGVTYDTRGRKIQLKDPDLGQIDYFVDARGLVWKQISPVQRALSQFTRFEYDVLGRMTARYESDLESHWLFDTAPNKGIGQLAEAFTGTSTVKDYRRTHTYDSLGRPSVTTQYLYDGSYVNQTGYDAWGRLIANTYQRNTDAPKVFDSRYNAYGYLAQLQRGALVLWKASKQDASQRPTEILLGNGLTQTRQYDPNAARLKSAILVTTGQTLRLQEGYQYDALGNVMQRSQYWDQSGFAETFDYDALNRLYISTVSGQGSQRFSFDDAGNLKSKSDVSGGSPYVYPAQGASAVRPHAIASIAGVGTGSFVYDTNGNLKSIPGVLAATWTSYDMPVQIAKGAVTSTFVYGPEHQRTRQTRSDLRTVIYAGAQEVENNNGAVTVKTYWPYGAGVEIDRPNTATELTWVHVDRLGSPVALSDASGNLRERLAYDAWGKRRTLNGAPLVSGGAATPNGIDGQTDNRGFTGHEMLDLLDLVHMNGRVYDPFLGKFLSADPLVQDPMNGQSYNRYSYVLNNPTNLTDPTGFSSSCEATTGSRLPDCSGTGGSSMVYIYGDNRRSNNNGKSDSAPSGKSDGKGNTTTDPKNPGLAKSADSTIQILHYANDEWSRQTKATAGEYFINGIYQTLEEAQNKALAELGGKLNKSVFDVIHIPTLGKIGDPWRAGLDKMGFTTETAKELAGIIQNATPGNWYLHSYGAVAFAEAVRSILKEGGTVPAGQSVTFLAGANNRWVTDNIMRNAGVNVRGYTGSWFDLVPNVIGLNSFNPIQWAVDIVLSPFLFTPFSSHSYPPVNPVK